jgi:hypothetical protein
VCALLYGAYAVFRGGAGYAAAALAAAVLTVTSCGQLFLWESTMTAGAGAALFAACAVGGFLLSRQSSRTVATAFAAAAGTAGDAWHILGLLGLAAVTFVGVPASGGGLPLMAVGVTGSHALLALGVLAMWIAVVAVTRVEAAGWVLFAWSFYALAAAVSWAYPDAHSAWYAVALVLLAIAWRQAEPISDIGLGIDRAAMTAVCRALLIAIPVGGLVASGVFFTVQSWPAAVLLGVAGVGWAADAVRSGDAWAFAPASAFGTGAAFLGGWTVDGTTAGAVWAGVAGAGFALGGVFGPRRADGWGAFLAVGGAFPATVAVIAGFGEIAHLAGVLTLVTVAWGLSGLAADVPELFGAAGVFASFSLLATLWWLDPAPLASYLTYTVLAISLFAPVALSLGAQGGLLRRAARPLGAAALVTTVQFAILGFIQTSIGQPGVGNHALQIGQPALAYGLLITGAIAVLWSAIEDFEMGGYVGYGAILLGILTLMDFAHVTQAEVYLIAVAMYAIAMGILYTRRDPTRAMPSAADGVAFTAAVVAPFLLSIASLDPTRALEHGLWTMFLAIVAIVGGLMSRTRLHFLGGIAIASL